MSEQDNGLQLAVNNLATEMRRANYLNAIGIGGGNTKRPTLYQEFGYPREITFNDFYNMYRRNAAGFAVVHRLLDGCWQDYPVIVDGDEAQEAKKTNPRKERHQVHEEMVAKGEGCRPPQYGRALLRTAAAGQRQSELGSGSRHCFSKTTRRVSAGKTYPCVGATVNRR